MFLDKLQVYDMNFEIAKYEHSLPAKSFFRTTRFRRRVDFAVDFRRCLKSFPLRARAVLRGAYVYVSTCIAPGGV
jgi:hypothetical protein